MTTTKTTPWPTTIGELSDLIADLKTELDNIEARLGPDRAALISDLEPITIEKIATIHDGEITSLLSRLYAGIWESIFAIRNDRVRIDVVQRVQRAASVI